MSALALAPDEARDCTNLYQLNGAHTLTEAGELCPQPPVRLVKSSAPGRRPSELDDPDWLASQLERHGERAIADSLGVARGTVRAAIARHREQIAARRLVASPRGQVQELNRSAATLIATRIHVEQHAATGPAPSLHLVATRVRALHDANIHGGRRDLSEALISLASACGLVVDHIARVEQR